MVRGGNIWMWATLHCIVWQGVSSRDPGLASDICIFYQAITPIILVNSIHWPLRSSAQLTIDISCTVLLLPQSVV